MTENPRWKELYPFESHWLEIDGQRMHYLDEGQGEPLLLVHGNPTWSFYWRELVSGLRERYRVVVPDHIGCGLSDKPSARQYPFRLARRVSDLGKLVEHLGLERVTLIAHDWGGAIGMGAAVERPDRFARFVLMNTAAFRSQRIPWRIAACRIPLLGRLGVQGMNLFVLAALGTAVRHHERMTPLVRTGLIAPYDTWPHREAVYRFVADIPLQPKHPSYAKLQEIEEGLATFAQRPVCLIWGMRDWCFTPHFLDRFIEFFPHATVHRLEDAGHYVVEDAHERIVPLVEEFLKNNPIATT